MLLKPIPIEQWPMFMAQIAFQLCELRQIVENKNEVDTKPETKKYITRKEACVHMGNITYPTLNKHTKEGLLKGYRIGRRVFYTLVDIDLAMVAIRTKTKSGGTKL